MNITDSRRISGWQGAPSGKSRFVACVGASFLLVACKTLPVNEPVSGSSALTSGATSSKSAEQEKTAGSSAAAVNLGASKTIALSSFEGDITCTRIVAPYDASDNLAALTDLATGSAVSSFSGWLDGALSGKSLRGTTGVAVTSARHNIPFQVRATALRMNWLPMKAELSYGRLLMDKMKDDMVARDSAQGRVVYPVADRMLADVLKGVNEPHAYQFEVFVRAGSGQNAMALPGGILILDAALVKDPKLRNKALFGLAHEVAHVLQRHETRAVQARIIDTISLRGTVQDLVKSIRSMRGDPMPLLQLALEGKLQFEKHFASQELHSDGCAVRILDKVLDNKGQLATVLQAFVLGLTQDFPAAAQVETQTAPRSMPLGLQSTADKVDTAANELKGLFDVVSRPIDRHPAPRERIENLTKTLREVTANARAAPKSPEASNKVGPASTKTINLPPVAPAPKKK